jgi:hypothetical protein
MPSRQGGNSADWSHLSRPDSCRTSGSSEEVIAFLPGSGSHVEFDVTHSKQTTAPILPGSRIAYQAIAARSAT